MASMAPAPGQPPVVPPKKVSPIVWIIGGVLGLFLLIGIALVVGGLFLVKKIADNPMLAAATAIAAANPDVEIVSSDSARGTVTFREKSSGKTVTLNLDQIKQGKMVFSEDGKEVTVEAGQGGVHMKGSDGTTVDIGSGSAKLPGWIPSYPGVQIQGSFSSTGGQEESATVGFTTKDAPDAVLRFFEDGFKKAGLKISNQTTHQEGGKVASGMLTAESEDSKRQAAVNVTSDAGEVSVALTYSSKK